MGVTGALYAKKCVTNTVTVTAACQVSTALHLLPHVLLGPTLMTLGMLVVDGMTWPTTTLACALAVAVGDQAFVHSRLVAGAGNRQMGVRHGAVSVQSFGLNQFEMFSSGRLTFIP